DRAARVAPDGRGSGQGETHIPAGLRRVHEGQAVSDRGTQARAAIGPLLGDGPIAVAVDLAGGGEAGDADAQVFGVVVVVLGDARRGARDRRVGGVAHPES